MATNKVRIIKEFLLKELEDNKLDLLDYAKKLNYPEENLLVLEGKEEEMYKKFPEIKIHLNSCLHNRDKRSMFEYAEDLVYSWLMEDYLFDHLKKYFILVHSGGDKERKIKPCIRITSESDFKIEYNGEKVALEISNDYTGLFYNRKICNLRDNKFLKLKENTNLTLMLGIDIINRYFFIINLQDFSEFKKIDSHYPFGGKPAYELDLKNVNFYPFNIEEIAVEIKRSLIK
jgi:hypothetical protein